jgi:hypothetical protein
MTMSIRQSDGSAERARENRLQATTSMRYRISFGFLTEGGFSNSAFTTVNSAVFAPMPSASVKTATVVNPVLCATAAGRGVGVGVNRS